MTVPAAFDAWWRVETFSVVEFCPSHLSILILLSLHPSLFHSACHSVWLWRPPAPPDHSRWMRDTPGEGRWSHPPSPLVQSHSLYIHYFHSDVLILYSIFLFPVVHINSLYCVLSTIDCATNDVVLSFVLTGLAMSYLWTLNITRDTKTSAFHYVRAALTEYLLDGLFFLMVLVLCFASVMWIT